jgi:hypothetical protein
MAYGVGPTECFVYIIQSLNDWFVRREGGCPCDDCWEDNGAQAELERRSCNAIAVRCGKPA